MPHLANIVNAINSHLTGGALKSQMFQGGKFYGLAQKVTIQSDENTTKPAIITSDGYGEEVTPDGTYPICLYHRCLNGAFQTENIREQFGDGMTSIIEANNMLMVVYADPKKIETTQEDLAYLIAAGLPQKRLETTTTANGKIAKSKIIPVSFDNDSQRVYTGEYMAGYFPQPGSIYFSLSYRIETTADRECVICP